jgi:Hypothetical glycosyl hydrolase family 15
VLARAWRILGGCVLATLSTLALATGAQAASAGSANVFVNAGSSYLPYLTSPSTEEQAWWGAHVWRMTVYTPYFDERTSWYHDGWVYKDAYAIYAGTPEVSEHPEWILKDASGHDLYIPWGCSGGSCPQYAADIASSSYRRAWIEGLRGEVAHGYRGVFVDDVNMSLDVGNGRGEMVAPIDPATGRPMSAEAWSGYMASFMQELRAALPNVEIAHNAVWFDEPGATANAHYRAQIESADYYFMERGANDPGLTGGNGSASLNAMLSFVEQVHAVGRHVVLDGTAEDERGLAFNLASYLLVSNGGDGVAGGGQTPHDWWAGWNVALGEALGSRYAWHGLQRRDFAGGLVLVNAPGEPSVTVSLPSPMRNLQGETVSSVTLAASSAAILQGSQQGGEAPSSKPSVPTQTIVETAPEPSGGSSGGEAPPASEAPSTSGTGAGGGSGGSSGSSGSSGTSGEAPSPPAGAERPHRHRRHRAQHARSASRGQPRRQQLTRIAGHVRGASAGAATIVVELRRGGRWLHVARLFAHLDGGGRFGGRLALRVGERYRVRAIYHGTTSFEPSRSAYRVLTTHAAAHRSATA